MNQYNGTETLSFGNVCPLCSKPVQKAYINKLKKIIKKIPVINFLARLAYVKLRDFYITKPYHGLVSNEVTMNKLTLQKNEVEALFDPQLSFIQEEIKRYRENFVRVEHYLETIQSQLDDIHQRCMRDMHFFYIEDFVFSVPREEWRVAALMSRFGFFEPGVVSLFKQITTPGMTIVDIGANIGQYTVLSALYIGNSGKVYAFEACPRTFYFLQENIRANGFAERNTVEAHNLCITNTEGVTRLYGNPGSFGLNNIYSKIEKNSNTFYVPSIPLDSFFIPGSFVNIIKIDIEGSEIEALKGMQRFLRENPYVYIIIEFDPCWLERAGHSVKEFLDLFEGWRIKQINAYSGELTNFNVNSFFATNSENLLIHKYTDQVIEEYNQVIPTLPLINLTREVVIQIFQHLLFRDLTDEESFIDSIINDFQNNQRLISCLINSNDFRIIRNRIENIIKIKDQDTQR